MEIKEKIMEHTKEVEDIIVKFLPAEEGYQKTVMEAMNYSFLAGGTSAPNADAGNVSSVWWQLQSD